MSAPLVTAGIGAATLVRRLLKSVVNLFRNFSAKAEYGDAILLLYVLAFARQYMWFVPHNRAAWVLTAFGAVAAWLFYVTTKEENTLGTPLVFWLLVAIPLAFVYSMRVAFPDGSYDVLNYRLLQAERALHGPLFMPSDFFPVAAPFNPTPDIVTGICRYLLGYRLGTIINLLVLLWAAQVLDKFLRQYVKNYWLRYVGVLFIMLTEHTLFEVNNYMVDLLSLPLILEAVYLTLYPGDAHKVHRNFVRVAFLLGLSAAFKLINLSVAVAIVPVYAYQLLFRSRPAWKELSVSLCFAIVAFILPLLPFTVYIYWQTGSPVFPMFNGFFKSPYWAAHSGWETRWGPKNLSETLVWPVLMTFRPERLAELGVYSGRISLGFVAALCGCMLVRYDSRARALCIIVLLGSLSWSAAMGYIRYGLHLELLSGLLILMLVHPLAGMHLKPPSFLKIGLASIAWLGLAVQAYYACGYIAKYEWGMRPTIFTRPDAYMVEAEYLLRDRSLRSFLSAGERALIDDVEVWVESGVKTAGLEAMLRPDVPIIGVRQDQYFVSSTSIKKYLATIDRVGGKKMYSLCSAEDLKICMEIINARGLAVVCTTQLLLPLYSSHTRISMILLKMRNGESEDVPKTSEMELPEKAYRARISLASPLPRFAAGTKETLYFKIKNLGEASWPSRVRCDGRFQVNIGDRWLDANGRTVVNDLDSRNVLRDDLRPGEEAEIALTVTAPIIPGDYVLEIDMVHEGVTWFHERGSETLRIRVRVEL